MNKIIQDPTSQMRTRGRVYMEMGVTMPNSDEVTIFLSDPVIRSEIKKLSKDELTPTEFIRYLDIDTKIQKIIDSKTPEVDKKKAIEDVRKLIKETLETPVTSTGSTGSIIPIPPPTKVSVLPSRTTTSTVSGEKKPCIKSVSGEPCK